MLSTESFPQPHVHALGSRVWKCAFLLHFATARVRVVSVCRECGGGGQESGMDAGEDEHAYRRNGRKVIL